MDIFYSIIAGLIQGLTEFLPISSSGHLVLFHDVVGFQVFDNLAFDVVLHLATILAVVVFFWQDIIRLLVAFIKSFRRFDTVDFDQRLAWYLFVATIPAAAAGYFFEGQIEGVFRNTSIVAAMLIFVGILLYLVDHYSKKVKDIGQLRFGNALVIGLAQALALLPGVSRSGITIIAALSQNFKRPDAARFSFLLSIPIVAAAGTKKLFDLVQSGGLAESDVLVLGVGFLAAAVTGYLTIKYFLQFLQSHSLKVFAYYRIGLGVLIILLMLFNF